MTINHIVSIDHGSYDDLHGGKLTMELVHFMTNTCGWGLKLIDGCTLGSGSVTSWFCQRRDGNTWISPGETQEYAYTFGLGMKSTMISNILGIEWDIESTICHFWVRLNMIGTPKRQISTRETGTDETPDWTTKKGDVTPQQWGKQETHGCLVLVVSHVSPGNGTMIL